jgi:glycosyltransferase involved in cell wall biosynthesis
LNITKDQSICIIIKQPIKELEEKYLAYIHSFIPNAVLEFNENPITDYNIMRNAKTLVCSCSTLSWIASFMGCENQLVYFPNYQSRWNHELFRRPHELIVYYDFRRCSEIDLWNKIGKVNYKKKILLVNGNIHHKNLHALNHYKKLEIDRVDDINNLDLSKYDAVYSPCKPVCVKDYPEVSFLFGPHFSVFPDEKDMEKIIGKNSIYIQPSLWAMNAWKNMDCCKDHSFDYIPWGVDTDKFQSRTERNEVFIYFKSRIPDELQLVENELKKRGIAYRNFDYKHRYSEEDYKHYLSKCKYGIWVDAHESQGFALQEALACNVPLLVWNVTSMSQEAGSNFPDINAKTNPYWDDRCGEDFANIEEISEKFNKLIQNINSYKPREYILENLSIEKCSEKFINLVNKI